MIIPFNIAKRLKKLGYHYPATSYWEIDTNTPEQRTLPILHIGCPVSDYKDSSWFKDSKVVFLPFMSVSKLFWWYSLV